MQKIEIVVRGHLDADWSDWLEGMTIVHTTDQNTILCGTVIDSSALYGLLTRLRDLGLTLISVITTGQTDEPIQQNKEDIS